MNRHHIESDFDASLVPQSDILEDQIDKLRKGQRSQKIFESAQNAQIGDEASFYELVFMYEGIVTGLVEKFTSQYDESYSKNSDCIGDVGCLIEDLKHEGFATILAVLRDFLDGDLPDNPVQMNDYLYHKIYSSVERAFENYFKKTGQNSLEYFETVAKLTEASIGDYSVIQKLLHDKQIITHAIDDIDYSIEGVQWQIKLNGFQSPKQQFDAEREATFNADMVKASEFRDEVDVLIRKRRPTIDEKKNLEAKMPFRTLFFSSIGKTDKIPGYDALGQLDQELEIARSKRDAFFAEMILKWGTDFKLPDNRRNPPEEMTSKNSQRANAELKQKLSTLLDKKDLLIDQRDKIDKQITDIKPIDSRYPQRDKDIARSQSYIASMQPPLDVDNPQVFEANEVFIDREMENRVVNRQLYSELWAVVNTLSEREVGVIKLRFGSGFTLNQVGAVMGVSQERIRQNEQTALKKLRRIYRNFKFSDLVD